MPGEYLLVGCVIGALAFGFSTAVIIVSSYMDAKQRRELKEASGGSESLAINLLSKGFSSMVLTFAIRQFQLAKGLDRKRKLPSFLMWGIESYGPKLRLSGLSTALDNETLCRVRVLACVYSCVCFSVMGVMVSMQIWAIGLFMGLVVGWMALPWAIGQEVVARKRMMERHLSEAIEVICLGLRSGLSFDFALRLYCQCFEGTLASELSLAMREWQAGLKTREQSLRDVASTYDSVIFSRVVESIVRSMRFGSPLAEGLEMLAAEARQSHKAQVEERVMKAPVKMMLPVGTLILPSMLILVLGPVLLDLAQGF